jgi:hypothetical protein
LASSWALSAAWGAGQTLCLLAALGASSCRKKPAPTPDPPPAASSAETAGAASPSAEPLASAAPPASAAVPAAPPSPPGPERYAWLQNAKLDFPKPVDTLGSRFATPPGWDRSTPEPGSYAEWLRGLPLAAAGTPVKNHKGDEVRPGDDEYVAAVIAIDAGRIDLQQSPDVVVRLHAEWLWSKKDVEGIDYRGATNLDMPFSRWIKGQRLIAAGASVFWQVRVKPAEADHAMLREYLDSVFTWANSTSLAQQSAHVEPDQLTAGDFFLHSGSPGHAVVVLDVAHKKSGERIALLGQALNPAQNIHVLRPGRSTAWFSLRPGRPVLTPYTDEFPWEGLRRLERRAQKLAD